MAIVSEISPPNTMLPPNYPKAVDGSLCFGCVERIQIDPNLEVPLDPFFIEIEVEQHCDMKVREAFDETGIRLEFVIPQGTRYDSEETHGFIVAGPSGATLAKQGQGFLLIEGNAYLKN